MWPTEIHNVNTGTLEIASNGGLFLALLFLHSGKHILT